ncbi:hypothetical protein CBR_g52087 [Chara braunii]|uniref:HAT C-terminal dimerisation domain-containing protein n=1 Tax=Chara braunii TaxID=69332 RepID=A0A388M9L5_CHABU|nr:hypothetical protein CBR_g52087 [Chara braunii]|eukprot:GBG91205.1 hypothetical protein CBR_g52087 [Chara braunii]
MRKARLGSRREELGRLEALDESALDPAIRALRNSRLCVAEAQDVQQEVLAELMAGQKQILAALQAPRPMMRQPQFVVAPPLGVGPSVTLPPVGPPFSPMFGMPPPGGYVATSGPVHRVSAVPSTTVVTTIPLSSQSQAKVVDGRDPRPKWWTNERVKADASTMHPAYWWYLDGDDFPRLWEVATKVLAVWLVPLLARGTGPHGFILTKRRNKLSSDSLQKPVLIHWNMQLLRAQSGPWRGFVDVWEDTVEDPPEPRVGVASKEVYDEGMTIFEEVEAEMRSRRKCTTIVGAGLRGCGCQERYLRGGRYLGGEEHDRGDCGSTEGEGRSGR